MEFLEAINLRKSYNTHLALDDVSITIPRQAIYGLLGPNGAGKTTFIRIITQIIKQDSGEVYLEGGRLNRKHMNLMGYLPEERGLYKKMTVVDLLLYLAQLKDVEKNEAKSRIKVWLEKFNLLSRADSKVDTLSKGMQQKLQFIATVVHAPKLIILDEPFSGFDPVNALLVAEEIKALRNQGCTIILSTHRMESVEALCDGITMINKSRKVLEGSIRDIKNSFRKSKFEIEYSGVLQERLGMFKIDSSEQVNEDVKRSVITLGPAVDSSQLICEISKGVHIHAFKELLPSMSEIFIEKVSA